MKYSYNWLKELSGTKKEVEEIADLFMTHSFEVESIDDLAKGLDKVVIGEVLEIKKHPNADRLNIAYVDVGKKNGGELQIVCGASNLKTGQKVPVALAGAILPNGEGGFEIRKSKIRGIESSGMICAEDELGLGNDHNGIMVLSGDAVIGESFVKFMRMDDKILDIDILPNRAHDCLSYEGVADELMALENYFGDLKKGNGNKKEVENYLIAKQLKKLTVKVNTENCFRYIGVRIENIKIKESPQWLKSRLLASGIGSINNIIDITNYIMLLTGQPMHAFDADKISEIVIRQAKHDENIKLLDKTELNLTENDMVITDGKKPIALAGIMGGLDSSITKNTKNIILESANFNSSVIRKTKSLYNLQTESAYRFERNIDPNIAKNAINKAIGLLFDIGCEGALASYNDIYPNTVEKWKIKLNTDYVKKLLGLKISQSAIIKILEVLKISITRDDRNNLICEIPTKRIDLKSQEDLIEEIGRIYGYDKIKPKPLLEAIQVPHKNKQRFFERSIKDILVGSGFDEVKTYSFYSKNNAQAMGLDKENHLSLINPLNPNQELIRQTLLSGVLDSCKKSLSYYKEIFIFDIGKIYIPKKENNRMKEELLLNLAVASSKSDGEQFFLLKESLENLFKKINLKKWHYDDDFAEYQNISYFHPTRRALIKVDNQVIGIIGEVDGKILKHFGIKKARVSVSELNIDVLLKELSNGYIYSSLAKFPSIERDLSVIVGERTKVSEVEKIIYLSGGDAVSGVEMIDLYISPEGERSMTFRIVFSHPEKTLTSQEVDRKINKIINFLEKKIGVKIKR